METLLELLERIKKYASWDDRCDKSELIVYLDEIHELVVDAIEMLNEKVEPIQLGLVLEGEDAREFEERMKNLKVTKEQTEFIKEAIEVYKSHPF